MFYEKTCQLIMFLRRGRVRAPLALLFAVFALVIPDSDQGASAAGLEGADLTWQITDYQVTDEGQTEATPEGQFTHHRIIEARAAGGSDGIVPEGRLVLTLNTFSPNEDKNGQKKGRWYLRGAWSLIDAKVPGIGGGRYPPGTLTGRIQADLAFDPATATTLWVGQIMIPTTRFAPLDTAIPAKPIRGEGLFTLVPSRRGGSLSLHLKFWSLPSQEKSS